MFQLGVVTIKDTSIHRDRPGMTDVPMSVHVTTLPMEDTAVTTSKILPCHRKIC